MDRLLRDRDAALEADPSFSGCLKRSLIDLSVMAANQSESLQQVREHLDYLDSKIGGQTMNWNGSLAVFLMITMRPLSCVIACNVN